MNNQLFATVAIVAATALYIFIHNRTKPKPDAGIGFAVGVAALLLWEVWK